jgi:hypothetical protein
LPGSTKDHSGIIVLIKKNILMHFAAQDKRPCNRFRKRFRKKRRFQIRRNKFLCSNSSFQNNAWLYATAIFKILFNQNDSFAASHYFAEQASIPFDDFMKMTVSNYNC